jgi:hypothetical protein
MKLFYVLLSFLVAGLMSCSDQTKKAVRDEDQHRPAKPTADQNIRISPGKCRIVGTLVSVDPTMDKEGPCSKAPCRGTVRVDSILGYGSAFGNPIATNTQIQVRFAFTVAPTSEDLFPNMTERLPGLNVGSHFQADLESQIEMNKGAQSPTYLVYDYRKLN